MWIELHSADGPAPCGSPFGRRAGESLANTHWEWIARCLRGAGVLSIALLVATGGSDPRAQLADVPAVTAKPEAPQPDYISGQVLDTSGDPIPEFQFRVRGGAVSDDGRGPDGSIRELTPVSHPQGEFQVKYRETFGEWQTVIAEAPGYVRRYHVLDFGKGDSRTDIRIVLDKAAPVEGTVVDMKGNPVLGAAIWIGPVPTFRRHGRPGHLAETDKRGRFISDHIPSGKVTLGVLHPDHPATSFDVELTSSETNQLHLVLPGGVYLSGMMTFGESPVQDGRVDLRTEVGIKVALTSGGLYQMRGVPPEATDVSFRTFRAESTGEQAEWSLRKHLDLARQEKRQVDISFPSGTARVFGELFMDGQAVGGEYGRSIYLTPEGDSGGLQVSTYANARGEFTLTDLPEGGWNLHAHVYDKDLGGFNFQQRISTRSGETTTLRIDCPPTEK